MKTISLHSSTAFRGRNILTPVFVELLTGTYKGSTVHIEITKENPPYFSQVVMRDPNGGPMYGVVIKKPNGNNLEPDLSRSCSSWEEVKEYIDSL